ANDRGPFLECLNGKGVLKQLFLLLSMHGGIADSRCSRSFTPSVLQEQLLLVRDGDTTHVMLAAIPRALVHRFFLTPDDGFEVLVRGKHLSQVVLRERIQLLDTHDGNVFAAFVATLFQQVVVDLTATHDQAFDLGWINLIDFAKHSLERAFGQVLQSRGGQLMAQQRLRRECNQRLAQRPDRLAAQHVLDLRWRGRYAYLDVLLSTELQVALQARRRVFRALPFITMWQQHGQTAESAPLVLTTGDELVDHNLSTVGEVTELSFPDHQCVRHGGGIAIFERQYRLFREEGVIQIEAWLTFVQVLQRNVCAAVLLVVQRGMAMREGSTSHVLAADAHRMTFE